MRNLSLILLTMLSLWSCEWAPDRLEIERETQVRSVQLALGDTTEIIISGYDLLIEEAGDENVILIEKDSLSQIRLIAKGVGETQLRIGYTLYLDEGQPEDAHAVIYFNVSISIGIPLNMYLGEWTTITLEDYLSDDDFLEIDSIIVHSANDSINVEASNQTKDLVSLYSGTPGDVRIEIIAFDSLGLQVGSLLFDAQISIRKKVLAEIYTNAGCVNCPEANHNMDLLYEAFPANFTAIRYHVFWTDPFDPMNLYNPTEVEDRRIFSGNSYEAPKIYMNGEAVNYADYSGLVSSVSQRISAGADVHIWKPTYTESLDSLFIDYEIENFSTPLSDLLIYSVLTQDSIDYEGTNGEKIHMQVMRDMTSTEIPELNGEFSLSHSLKRIPGFDDNDNLHLVLFVQDIASKAILQVSDFSVSELLP